MEGKRQSPPVAGGRASRTLAKQHLAQRATPML